MSSHAFIVALAVLGVGCGPPLLEGDWQEREASGRVSGPVTRLTGEGGGFGAAVRAAGDFDGDGFDDLLVTAPGLQRIYAFRGSPGGVLPAAAQVYDAALLDDDRPGDARGDFNGDGMSDVVWHDSTQLEVRYGRAGGPNLAPDWSTPSAHPRWGAAAADIDGDDFTDLVVVDDQGDLAVYPGGPGGLAAIPTSRANLGGLGRAASAGDLDDDGFQDVLATVGSPICLPRVGACPPQDVVLVMGGPNGIDATVRATFTAPKSITGMGSAGHVDGDRFGDLWVRFASPREPTVGFRIVAGAAGGVGHAIWTWRGACAGNLPCLTGGGRAGDTDSDGFADVLVGQWDPYAGGVVLMVVHGPRGYVERWTVDGAESLAGAGDVNDDGYDDVAVGDPTGDGTVDVYHGGPR